MSLFSCSSFLVLPFIDVEHESHRIRGRICFVTGLHGRKLMSVCCEQLTDNNHGVL